MDFKLMQNVHLSQKTFPALSSNFPLVDMGSFGHLLGVKGKKTSGFSIYFANGHGRDIEIGYQSTNHSLLSTPCKSLLNLSSLNIFTTGSVHWIPQSSGQCLWLHSSMFQGTISILMNSCLRLAEFYMVLEDFSKNQFCC